MQICLILCFSWSILVKFCVYLRTSSSRTQMRLLEKDILLYSNCYLFILINRQSIHPIQTHMSTRRLMTLPLKIWKTSFYSSDLTTYPKIIFQLFFITKRDGLSFRSTGRGISLQNAMKSSSLSSLTNSHLTRDQAFFRGKGKKRTTSFSPRLQKKKGRRTT